MLENQERPDAPLVCREISSLMKRPQPPAGLGGSCLSPQGSSKTRNPGLWAEIPSGFFARTRRFAAGWESFFNDLITHHTSGVALVVWLRGGGWSFPLVGRVSSIC